MESDSELEQSYESDDSELEYNLSQHTKLKLRKRRLIMNEHLSWTLSLFCMTLVLVIFIAIYESEISSGVRLISSDKSSK